MSSSDDTIGLTTDILQASWTVPIIFLRTPQETGHVAVCEGGTKSELSAPVHVSTSEGSNAL